ncbi:MAG: gliding motility-associated C-terminal domain-containing protein [Bacteroidetes bacterium]|nr:gliding motility-associated C-terminal domain-containing protein [Bacteroidota bacterium]
MMTNKNKFSLIFFWLIVSFLGVHYDVLSTEPKSCTKSNPLNSDVFIENVGQFDTWCKSSFPVRYAVNNGGLFFFTSKGLIIRIDYSIEVNESEREKSEKHPTGELIGPYTFYISMEWEGSNPEPRIEVSDQSEGYFTFGEKNFEETKLKGYRKLMYKEVYPGIDIEYTVPIGGGVKSVYIIHPGANPNVIKMHYSGDIRRIRKDKHGNIRIITPAGDIIEHAPSAFYEDLQLKEKCNFKLSGKNTCFFLPKSPDSIHTLLIDPWTTIPNTLTTTNAAYDTDVDDAGNVFVSGGSFPNKLAKYNSSGTIIWTYTNPINWSNMIPWGTHGYSKFCLLRNSGTTFIAEGWNNAGPKVMKINSDGTIQFTSVNFTGNEEIWVMFYNRCTGQLIGFGGGTTNVNNMQIIADTNLSSSLIKNFNGYAGVQNDITSVKMDDNGDFYVLMTSVFNTCNNHLMKSLASAGYNPPCAFDVPSGYFFTESIQSGIPGFHAPSVSETARSNTVALNQSYVYTYDGKTLKAWNKTNGNMLGSVVVNAGYSNGGSRTHEGIVADECNRVYVGGNNMVHVYTFNGTNFSSQTNITTGISGEVYDLIINNSSNSLIACGNGFLSLNSSTPCSNINQLSFSVAIDTCQGNASLTINGGIPPYTYLWSNGATTSNVSGIPNGTQLTVTVSDNACNTNVIVDTINFTNLFTAQINAVPGICPGESAILTATGGGNYLWSTGQATASISVNPSSTTNYTVTVSFNGCVSMVNVTLQVYPVPVVGLGNDTSFCQVPSFTIITDTGFASYLWSTSDTTPTISVSQSGSYWISVTNSFGCINIDTINIEFGQDINIQYNISICQGDSLLCGGEYHSNSGVYTDVYPLPAGCDSIITTNLTVLSLFVTQNDYNICAGDSLFIAEHYYFLPGLYYDTLTAQGGCDSILVTNLGFYTLPVVDLGPDKVICTGDTVELDCQVAGFGYLWSTGSATQSILVNQQGNYIITVSDSHGCSSSDSCKVSLLPLPILFISPANPEICFDSSVVINVSGADNYTWFPATGLSSTTGASVIASPHNSITYYISGSNFQGCSKDTLITVHVLPSPYSVLEDSTYLCIGDFLLLDPGNCDFCHYLWSNGSVTPTITVNLPGIFSVQISNQSCAFIDTILVKECTEIWIPNVFTPNGDGKNDHFVAKGVHVEEFKMYIFNRWGQQLCEINDMYTGWDGSYKGSACPDGVYYYLIFYKGHGTGHTLLNNRKHGALTLLR